MANLINIPRYGTDFLCVNAPEYFDCCIHCLCLAGSARFRYYDKEFVFSEKQLAVMSAPQQLSAIEPDDAFRCEYIIAPLDYLHSLLPVNNYSLRGGITLMQNPIIPLDDDDFARMREDFAGIERRVGNISHCFYSEMLGSLLRTMIYDIFDTHYRRDGGAIVQTSRVGYVVTKFMSMIEEGAPTIHRSPAWYADKLCITVKYLGETVRRITGMSVSDHINRQAASQLREYLETTHLSVSEIAEMMGFNSLSYFSRYCKLHLGASPSEIRTCIKVC